MRAKSIKLLTVLLLIAFSAAIFTGCKEESLVSQETVSQDPILQEVFEEYSKIIEQQTIDDLRLKIYIEDETFFNWKFWRTADELIGSSHTSMIEIDSSKLNAHKDALRLLDPNQLTRVEYDS